MFEEGEGRDGCRFFFLSDETKEKKTATVASLDGDGDDDTHEKKEMKKKGVKKVLVRATRGIPRLPHRGWQGAPRASWDMFTPLTE